MTTIIEHNNETITLVELVRKVEDEGRGFSDAVKHVKTGHWDTFEDFLSYFDHHYKPMLERVQSGHKAYCDDILLRHFTDDMLEIFSEEENQ